MHLFLVCRANVTQQNADGTLRDLPSPPEELLTGRLPVGTSASGENSNSSTIRSRLDMLINVYTMWISFAVFCDEGPN